jgi:hypothetical protein
LSTTNKYLTSLSSLSLGLFSELLDASIIVTPQFIQCSLLYDLKFLSHLFG